MGHIWLRSEDKKFERRVLLIPQHAKQLIDMGHIVTVEESTLRIFPIEEYKSVGCEIVKAYTWPLAPTNTYILGIKELHDIKNPIKHNHIFFSHSFKNQPNSRQFLNNVKIGGGFIYDLEYFCNKSKERVLTFGFYAGVAAAAIALLGWSHIKKNIPYDLKLSDFCYKISSLIIELQNTIKKFNRIPTIVVIGAYGRSGMGVSHLLEKLNIAHEKWGEENTYNIERMRSSLLKKDILINCISTDEKSFTLLQAEDLVKNRNLSLIVDLSCDVGSKYNSLPIYNEKTNFIAPLKNVFNEKNPLWIISIDNLATFIPYECSVEFSSKFYNYLLDILNKNFNICIKNVEFAFDNIIKTLI